MIDYKLSAEDKRWKAESDFRQLTEAETIKADKKRMGEAIKAGKRVLIEEEKRLKQQEKVVKSGKRITKNGTKIKKK